jgi:hypothetical protein
VWVLVWGGASSLCVMYVFVTMTLRALSLLTAFGETDLWVLLGLPVATAVAFLVGLVLVWRMGLRSFIPAVSLMLATATVYVSYLPVGLMAMQSDWYLKRPAREYLAEQVIAASRTTSGTFSRRIPLSGSDRWLSEGGAVYYVQAPGVRTVYFERFHFFGSLLGDYYVSQDSTSAPPEDGPHARNEDSIGGLSGVRKLDVPRWYEVSAD